MDQISLKIRTNIESCVRLGKFKQETLGNIQRGYGQDALKFRTILQSTDGMQRVEKQCLMIPEVGGQRFAMSSRKGCERLSFKEWVDRCKKCISYRGEYFEGEE